MKPFKDIEEFKRSYEGNESSLRFQCRLAYIAKARELWVQAYANSQDHPYPIHKASLILGVNPKNSLVTLATCGLTKELLHLLAFPDLPLPPARTGRPPKGDYNVPMVKNQGKGISSVGSISVGSTSAGSTSPGCTLLEIMNERKLSSQQIMEASGLSANTILSILDGTIVIDEPHAIRLERATGVQKDFWIKRDQAYQKYKEKVK